MKLIIQIPCFNEEQQLPHTLSLLPRELDGFDAVEWLIIDDGSTDKTIEVAKASGVDHIVRLTNHKGLAAGFQAGMDAGLKLGADVIVNTDADNQYDSADIPKLVAPILRGDADMVVGDRQVGVNEHFSWHKRRLQRLGSWVVRQASSTEVPDTTSGFRAYNREAALQMQAVSRFTYTLETIIQAGKKKMAIAHLPIEAQETRPSRLFTSTWDYVKRSGATILRIYAMYEPFKVFVLLGSALFFAGVALGLRYAYFWWLGDIRGHIQSAILSVLLLILGFQTLQWGIMADLIASNRKLLEDLLYRVRRAELEPPERRG
jgi:glycosyltransferase involved in cell wall biosynthesis